MPRKQKEFGEPLEPMDEFEEGAGEEELPLPEESPNIGEDIVAPEPEITPEVKAKPKAAKPVAVVDSNAGWTRVKGMKDGRYRVGRQVYAVKKGEVIRVPSFVAKELAKSSVVFNA